MNYQFIVINISAERKKLIEEQFKKINKKCNIIFMNGFTPSNSEEYLTDITINLYKREACCVKSHLCALEIASNSSDYDFSIILEDDLAFHKTQFLNIIEELIDTWEEKIYPNKMISLGWVPVKNYSDYVNRPSYSSFKSILGSKLFNTFRAVGLQCYMVRKKDIKDIIPFFLKSTYKDLKIFYLQFLQNNNLLENFSLKNESSIPADYIINWILEQKILFPPIAIEKPIKSTIAEETKTHYHDIFFKDYEMIKDDYFLE